MISTATKTLQANNKMIYIALLSTLTFFLFLDYIPGLEAWPSACVPRIAMNSCPASTRRESMLTPVISMFESPATSTGWIAFSNSFNNITLFNF